ncbi:MAG: hypothetical protein SCH71_16555 [Desulfobulbaceae bacterium]|nr:hypothetical protein [Desulfobulbaceae bacterium]
MKDNTIVLATDKDGNEITIGQVEEWLKDKQANKKYLSSFVYDRLYGRYIKPFDFENKAHPDRYKNGFTIMANCCLLIEAYASFREKSFTDTNGKSERCFGWFFLTENRFIDFSKNGLPLTDYLNKKGKLNNTGVPRDFYINVRCGIMHNAETRNGWKILRRGSFYDEKSKTINAVKFMNRLKNTLVDYKKTLEDSGVNTEIWNCFVNRLNDVISKA